MSPTDAPHVAPASPPISPPRRGSLAMAGVGALAVGLSGGFVLGRTSLEHTWSSPLITVSPDMARASSSAGADPTPAAGSRVLRAMPLARSRQELASITRGDPVLVVVGSVGRDDEGMHLNLVLKNRGACVVTAARGVAYGFDAWNHPARLNKAGEHYVAFSLDKLSLAPGQRAQPQLSLKHPELASLVVGHIDEVTCEGGKTWRRP